MGVGGNANVAGNLRVASSLFVGANTTFTGSITSNIIPTANNTYTIGNNTTRWIMFGSNGNFANTLSVAGIIQANSGVQLQDGSQFNSISFTTSGTFSQNVDTFSTSTFRSAEYVISVKDNNANGYQVSKILVVHDGTVPYMTEFGVVQTNTNLGVFATSISTGNVYLSFTPVSSSTTLKIARILMVV